MDDIVQDAYGRNVREQRTLFARHPFQFLRGLLPAIERRILQCGDRVPVVTGNSNFLAA